MPSLFFQKYWHIVADSVSSVIMQVLNSSHFPEGFNPTFITLIPKRDKVSRVKDFQPISLCNVLYKLVTKIIANRLKIVLPKVILKTQNAFVLKRQISNNILVAYELNISLGVRRKENKISYP